MDNVELYPRTNVNSHELNCVNAEQIDLDEISMNTNSSKSVRNDCIEIIFVLVLFF